MNALVEPVRQCAWCYRVVDSLTGVYGGVAVRKINSATHGICPRCKDGMLAEIDDSPALAA
jgi:hypothetical protein